MSEIVIDLARETKIFLTFSWYKHRAPPTMTAWGKFLRVFVQSLMFLFAQLVILRWKMKNASQVNFKFFRAELSRLIWNFQFLLGSYYINWTWYTRQDQQPKKHHNIDTPSLVAVANLIWISNTTLKFYYQNKVGRILCKIKYSI